MSAYLHGVIAYAIFFGVILIQTISKDKLKGSIL